MTQSRRAGANDGRRALARCLLGGSLALGSILTASDAPAQASAEPAVELAGPSTTAYRPLTPCRLLDTREGGVAKPGGGSSMTLAVRGHCGVAVDSVAVAVTVTVTEAEGSGYITAWPSGLDMPLASTNNYATGETRANAALLSLGDDGNLRLFTSRSAHLIVDVSGEFYPATSPSSGRYIPVAPFRLRDTRDDGPALPRNASLTVALPAGVPADATAMAVMLTITESPAAGFVTAYPAGSARPLASSLNTDKAHQIRTATQIVPVSAEGLTVFTNTGGHIIVDVAGYFSGASEAGSTGLFIPATPTRIMDTREAVRVFPGGTVVASTAGVTGPDAAAAVAANVTVTESGPSGYVTAWAAQTAQPGTPAVSYGKRGETVANMNLVSVSTAGLAIASTSGTHAVVDITGWFTGVPLDPTTGPADNTHPPYPQPSGPIGCLQYVPAPTPDGLYHIQPGTHQQVAHIFTAGPKGPIVVVGDSLTTGSIDQTARALRANGWGPICVDGTVSRTVEFGIPSIPDGLDAVARIKASDPIWSDATITWVVSLGTNDVGFSGGNAALSDQYVADQAAAIGPNPIAWMNVRTGRAGSQHSEAVFNQSIRSAGMQVIDWYSASAGQPWLGSDLVHLTTSGYQARANLLATVTSH